MRTDAELGAAGVLEHPVTSIGIGSIGRGQADGHVNRLPRRNRLWEGQRIRATHLLAALEDQLV